MQQWHYVRVCAGACMHGENVGKIKGLKIDTDRKSRMSDPPSSWWKTLTFTWINNLSTSLSCPQYWQLSPCKYIIDMTQSFFFIFVQVHQTDKTLHLSYCDALHTQDSPLNIKNIFPNPWLTIFLPTDLRKHGQTWPVSKFEQFRNKYFCAEVEVPVVQEHHQLPTAWSFHNQSEQRHLKLHHCGNWCHLYKNLKRISEGMLRNKLKMVFLEAGNNDFWYLSRRLVNHKNVRPKEHKIYSFQRHDGYYWKSKW